MAVSLSPLEQIRAAEARAVGASQTVKAVRKGWALLVLVARDADRKVTEPVVRAAQEAGVPLAEVDSMREVGRACGIAVGAAAAPAGHRAAFSPSSPVAEGFCLYDGAGAADRRARISGGGSKRCRRFRNWCGGGASGRGTRPSPRRCRAARSGEACAFR